MNIQVGVGVLIFRDGKVLLGKRKGSHGASSWGLPGGHLDVGESIASCAARETLEETGLVIDSISHAGFTSDVFEAEDKHYVTLFVLAADPGGEPEIMEQDKCESWQWFAWNQLPQPLFEAFGSLVDQGFQLPSSV